MEKEKGREEGRKGHQRGFCEKVKNRRSNKESYEEMTGARKIKMGIGSDLERGNVPELSPVSLECLSPDGAMIVTGTGVDLAILEVRGLPSTSIASQAGTDPCRTTSHTDTHHVRSVKASFPT